MFVQPVVSHAAPPGAPGDAALPESARKGARRAFVPEGMGYAEVPVYDRYALGAGATLAGPAIVEERESTVVLGARARARVDEWGTLIVDLE